MRQLSLWTFVAILCTSFAPYHHDESFSVSKEYSVVDYDKNKVVNINNIQSFYNIIDQYVSGRRDKITITHIGDSHIQADFLTNEARSLFQKTFGNGGRGFVFPYRMLRTNGPLNVGVRFGGDWQSCRSILSNNECNFGLGGITATTFDTGAFIRVDPNIYGDMNYEFDRMKLFYFKSPNAFDINLLNADSTVIDYDIQPLNSSVSEIFFQKMQDSFWLSFNHSNNQKYFQLFGMSLENANRGLVYNAIGQNGAFVNSFLRQGLFEEQLAVMRSDLIIVSLGTNDGYKSEGMFCQVCFKDNYRTLIERIKRSSPNAAILLTTPGDFYVRQKYHNSNIVKMNEAIYELATEFELAIWDFNKIMGGDNSVKKWKDAGLARGDLVHFSEEGYLVQGRLLFEAIMEGYERRFD